MIEDAYELAVINISIKEKTDMDNQTIFGLVGLLFTIIMSILLYCRPREYAMLPIVLVAFFLTSNLRIIIADFDFTMLRLILFVGWVRILNRSEVDHISLNFIDKIVISMVVMRIITYTIMVGTFGAFINRLGGSYNIISSYFISRALIRNIDDIKRIVNILLIISIPISIFMINENITGKNLFSVFGGVPVDSFVRNGEIRAQGTFAHPILAGNFGAALFPLIVGLWWSNGIKFRNFIIGIITSTAIVITSFSSGPLVACLAGIMGLCFWNFHKNMRIVIWGGGICLIALHIVMKAPIWALIMRFGSSGSAYHRFNIVDKTIKNFGEWWLIGIESTSQWGSDFALLGDVANFYCRIAVDGGLIGLILFLMIIIYSFKAVGKAIRQIDNQPYLQKFIWAIGASLFAHTMAFIGISYMGSNLFMLYMTVAILSTISTLNFQNAVKQ